jgi:type I restriction modification DNA specificity protein
VFAISINKRLTVLANTFHEVVPPVVRNERYLFALTAEGENIRDFGMGSTHTTIYFPEIRALHIALPPVAEQKEIVARVKGALARIKRYETEAACTQQLLDRLEAAIFTQAFRGELAPQDPADEPASVLLERIRNQRDSVAATGGKRRRSSPQTASDQCR